MFFLFGIILYLMKCRMTLPMPGWAGSPGFLNLSLEGAQNRAFNPKASSMVLEALPDGDTGMSHGGQPMGTAGMSAAGLSRDVPNCRGLVGSCCPDPGSQLEHLFQPSAEAAPSIGKWV